MTLIIIVLFQVIKEPGKIPNIFGYKIFIIIDENMDESVNYGDLALTHNINPKDLKTDDVVAFRNYMDTVTIHRITHIDEKSDGREFIMNTALNETQDTKFVKEYQIEGILVKTIADAGLIILHIQEPTVIIKIITLILIIGLIVYYIAEKLDIKDEKKLKEKETEGT